MIKRVNNDQPYCGVNVKGSEGTCLALDFHGTMVIFVKRLIILFYRRLSDQVSTITDYGLELNQSIAILYPVKPYPMMVCAQTGLKNECCLNGSLSIILLMCTSTTLHATAATASARAMDVCV